jgi:hypothetical protein
MSRLVFHPSLRPNFKSIRGTFRKEGIDPAAPFMVMDSPGAGGGYVGDFIIQAAQIVVPVVGVVIGAWLKGRSGRKARVTFYNESFR